MTPRHALLALLVLLCNASACLPSDLSGEGTDMGTTADMPSGTPDMPGTSMDMPSATPDMPSGMPDMPSAMPDMDTTDMTETSPNPFMTSDTAAVMAGEMFFNNNGCTGCHNDADGGLSKIKLSVTATKSDQHIFDAIKNGVPGTIMSSYASTFPDEDDIWRITTYIKATYGQ